MTKSQGRWLRVLSIAPLFFLTMVLAHEAGHAAAARYFMHGEVEIYVWPGYRIYPGLGESFPRAWPARTPALTFVAPVPLGAVGAKGFANRIIAQQNADALMRHEPLVKLMGSATNSLLALASLALLSLCKPKGLLLWLLSAGGLLHLDMLTYAVLPTLFGVRHLYWVGGNTPEPVEALVDFGLPETFALTAIVLLSLLQCGWLFYLLKVKLRRLAQPC